MKITKQQLNSIIQEEMTNVLREKTIDDMIDIPSSREPEEEGEMEPESNKHEPIQTYRFYIDKLLSSVDEAEEKLTTEDLSGVKMELSLMRNLLSSLLKGEEENEIDKEPVERDY